MNPRSSRLLAVLALAALVAACTTGSTPSATTTPATDAPSVSAAAATAATTASPTATPAATPAPTPTAAPTATPIATCLATHLKAKVTAWSGAMGSQIANITITNVSAAQCKVRGTPEVELVDANGAILIDSQTAGAAGLPHIAAGDPTFVLSPNGILKTQAAASNYCGGTTPALPTTIAFVLPSGAGRIVAAPGPGGSTPPCNGAPGSLGTMSMNGWVQ